MRSNIIAWSWLVTPFLVLVSVITLVILAWLKSPKNGIYYPPSFVWSPFLLSKQPYKWRWLGIWKKSLWKNALVSLLFLWNLIGITFAISKFLKRWQKLKFESRTYRISEFYSRITILNPEIQNFPFGIYCFGSVDIPFFWHPAKIRSKMFKMNAIILTIFKYRGSQKLKKGLIGTTRPYSHHIFSSSVFNSLAFY